MAKCMRLCLCMWGRGGGLLPTPTWNEKHSHLADFIIWESSSPGNDSHLEDFNTCEVFSIANDSYSRIFLIWYTDPAKPAKCQSVNANVNHYHLDSRYLAHIPKSSEDFAVCYLYFYLLTPEVLQRCNTLLHFITL